MSKTLLLNCQSLSKSYGSRLLFKDLFLSIFSQDKIGLIGPNGSGKSTLLKILCGIEKTDSGVISMKQGLQIGYVAQSCEYPDMHPRDVLIQTLDGKNLEMYEKEDRADTWLAKLGFKGDEKSAAKLSGGWKKRLSIAEQLIQSPDLLLLDEPTNHLDLEGILWLEAFLKKEVERYMLVTHDRYFLQNVANKIIEINPAFPGGMFSIDGSYETFLENKENFLKGQLEYERSLRSKARRETDWLRRSPKARTTKSKSRIDEAHELFDELSDVQKRNIQKTADIDFAASKRETQKLVVAKNLSKEINGKLLFKNLDFTLSPGSRIGLMGLNGSGKTTLLRLVSGELMPDQGTIKRADPIEIVYFDQHRAKLPEAITLREALCPHGEYVQFHGQSIHVNGWCKRFLFSPELLDLPVGKFSGGEKARIAIAHLMLKPADILLLDEPTNDLDIPTLETLEETLIDFPGAVMLITHDRCMLDRICTTMIGLGDPEHTQMFADYLQWQESLETMTQEAPKEKPKDITAEGKISYAELKEYNQIESKISKLETEIQKLTQLLENPEVAEDPNRLEEVCKTIGIAETQIEQLYIRWDELGKKL